MEKTLKPLVDQLVSLIQNGVDFVKGQIPDVAVQILHFKAAEAWLQILFPLGAFLIFGLPGLYFLKRSADRDFRDDANAVVAATLCTLSVICFIILLINGYDSVKTLLEIHYAPKVFLLEYLKDILSH